MRQRVLGGLSIAASSLVLSVTSYLALLTAAAWVASRRRCETSATDRDVRFVVLVPAHDEERLIGETVRALLDTDYPRGRIRIVVVADHCTDRTAAAAAAAGAEVLLHDDPEPRGKGAALRWALDTLDQRPDDYDAVAIVDADSVVNRQFLSALAHRLGSGSAAVQACYLVRRAEASSSTGLREAALALRHFVRPLGRTTLGGSAGLYGNGMAFSADLARRHSWSDHLTEDLEFQLEHRAERRACGLCAGRCGPGRDAGHPRRLAHAKRAMGERQNSTCPEPYPPAHPSSRSSPGKTAHGARRHTGRSRRTADVGAGRRARRLLSFHGERSRNSTHELLCHGPSAVVGCSRCCGLSPRRRTAPGPRFRPRVQIDAWCPKGDLVEVDALGAHARPWEWPRMGEDDQEFAGVIELTVLVAHSGPSHGRGEALVVVQSLCDSLASREVVEVVVGVHL